MKRRPRNAPKSPRKPNVSIRRDIHEAVRDYSKRIGRSQGEVVEMAVLVLSEHRPLLREVLVAAQEELTA